MTKLSVIQREIKRFNLLKKFYFKLKNLKNILSRSYISGKPNYDIIKKIQKIPRNSNLTRLRNRCYVTGRGRGVFRRFKLSRHVIRELAFKGYIPGIVKASW